MGYEPTTCRHTVKKLLMLLLCIAFVTAALASCGGEEEDGRSQTDPPPAETSAQTETDRTAAPSGSGGEIELPKIEFD